MADNDYRFTVASWIGATVGGALIASFVGIVAFMASDIVSSTKASDRAVAQVIGHVEGVAGGLRDLQTRTITIEDKITKIDVRLAKIDLDIVELRTKIDVLTKRP